MNTLANGNMCKRRKVFSFNSELYKVTGVQKVLMDIHHAVKEDYDAIIVGTVSYGMVDKSHQIFEKISLIILDTKSYIFSTYQIGICAS